MPWTGDIRVFSSLDVNPSALQADFCLEIEDWIKKGARP